MVLSCCIWVLCALSLVSPQNHSITQAGHFCISLVQPPVQSRVSCYLRLAHHSRLYPVWSWKHSRMNAKNSFSLVMSIVTLISSQNFCFNSCSSVSSVISIKSLANLYAEFRRLPDMIKSHLLSKMSKFCSLSFSTQGSSFNHFGDSSLHLLKFLTPFL